MCGIVGIISTRGNIFANDKKVFNQMLHVDVLRGPHSTGVFNVTMQGESSFYKKAVNSSDFLEMKKTQSLIESPSVILVGHNRYATQGAINNVNAHPFKYGHITLVHNGSLVSTTDLPDNELFTVDSENIAYSIYKQGAEKTIKALHGAFVLVWHDSSDNTINIVRNSERPLSIAEDTSGDLYFASEEGMLRWILERNNSNIDKVYSLEVGTLLKIKVGSTERSETVVELRKPKINSYQGRQFKNEFIACGWRGYTSNTKGRGVVSGYLTSGGHQYIEVHNFQEEDYKEGGYVTAINARIVYKGREQTYVSHQYEIDEYAAEEEIPPKKLSAPLPECAWCGDLVEKKDKHTTATGAIFHMSCHEEYNADVPEVI